MAIRTLTCAGLILGSFGAASAQIIIDDFSEGSVNETRSWIDDESVQIIGSESGSMLGGSRLYVANAFGDGIPGSLTFRTTRGQVLYNVVDGGGGNFSLNYFTDGTDFSGEESVFIDLGDGTNTSGDVTLLMGSGETDNSFATQSFIGSGIVKFDLASLRGSADLGQISRMTVRFGLPVDVPSSVAIGTFGPDVLSGPDQTIVVSNISTVPEPGTMLALGLGGALVALRRRKKQAS